MAPLPQNNTARLFVDYTDGIWNHTCAVRYNATAVDLPVVCGVVAGWLNQVTDHLVNTWQVLGLRQQAQGGDVTLPYSNATLEAVVGTAASTFYDKRQAAVEASWEGRSPVSGRFGSLSLFGFAVAPPANFRWGLTDLGGDISASIVALTETQAGGVFVNIDDNDQIWKPYVNVQYNSYWERKARG